MKLTLMWENPSNWWSRRVEHRTDVHRQPGAPRQTQAEGKEEAGSLSDGHGSQ